MTDAEAMQAMVAWCREDQEHRVAEVVLYGYGSVIVNLRDTAGDWRPGEDDSAGRASATSLVEAVEAALRRARG